MLQVEVHPKVLVLPSTRSGQILAPRAQAITEILETAAGQSTDINNPGFTSMLHC